MLSIRVLVADDNEVFRKALCDFLQYHLHMTVVATAQDGVEALRLVKEMKPDLLILDINMPQMDGWEVLCQLQDSSLPVATLILSIHSSLALKERALNSGAAALVPKGNIQLLTDTLHQLLDDFTG